MRCEHGITRLQLVVWPLMTKHRNTRPVLLPSNIVADIVLTFTDESLKKTLFRDGKMQLLFRLMGAERVGERGISSLSHC